MTRHASPRLRRLPGTDAALAAVVVAGVALMVVPLPTWLLDVLLAGNLAASIAILLVTLYAGSALEMSTFPVVLLVTTLVRVALNVSSTRLILLHANAGAVIQAFGSFVVSGNFVVGSVVFLILTVIEFVVVVRGSERVAEVGARFALDALPGKQMAIDAELRAAAIDAGEARRRRRDLERESHFYGAMDGAVKFVKGDAVATVLIAIVNLVGGVAIGVSQRGLDASAALRRYGLLTIGDGLVTQIPALLLATAAGILVTRVSSAEEGTALATELSAEILRVPRALGIASAVVAALGLVPGLPAVPFFAVGAGLLALSRWPRRSPGDLAHADGPSRRFVPGVVPWSLELGPVAASALGGERALSGVAERLRSRVFAERGVPMPPCDARVAPSLEEWKAVLSIREVPAVVVPLERAARGPALASALEDALGPVLVDRAADFLGIAETKALLDALGRHTPATVGQIVPRVVEVAALSEILRRLVDEHVSIRDLKTILESLSRAHTADRDAHSLAEHVRTELRRPLTFTLTGGAPELDVILLDVALEDAIRAAISKTSAGSFLAMAPAAARDVVSAVRRAIDRSDAGRDRAVVLTRPDIRRFVKTLLETDLPRVRVVSFAELLPEVTLKESACATLADT